MSLLCCSSRYYVLRIADPQHPNRSAIIGIGFRERDTALDFKHVLNEYVRYIDRMSQAEQLAVEYVSMSLNQLLSTMN